MGSLNSSQISRLGVQIAGAEFFKDLAEVFELRRELGLSSDGLDASISDGNGTGEAASLSRRIVKALRPECEASGNRKVAGTPVTCDMYDMGSQLRGAQCAGAAR